MEINNTPRFMDWVYPRLQVKALKYNLLHRLKNSREALGVKLKPTT